MPFSGFKDFADCVSKQIGKGHDKESASKICGAIKAKTEGVDMDWHKLSFTVPIIESYVDNTKKEFLIKGIAINETTTRNNVTYLAEELSKSYNSLRNKPLLKNHTNDVDAIVGKVVSAEYDAVNKNIQFTAKVIDEAIKEKIKQGLLSSVSIGATVQELSKEVSEQHGERVIARGIDFLELSLVAVPSDPGAAFAKAIYESAILKEASIMPIETKVIEATHDCPECPKQFASKPELSKHMKKTHPDEEMEEKIKSYIAEIASLKTALTSADETIVKYKNRKIKVEVK